MIEHGANVNAVESEWKMTPLHWIAVLNSSSPQHEDWTDDDSLSNLYNFIFSAKNKTNEQKKLFLTQ